MAILWGRDQAFLASATGLDSATGSPRLATGTGIVSSMTPQLDRRGNGEDYGGGSWRRKERYFIPLLRCTCLMIPIPMHRILIKVLNASNRRTSRDLSQHDLPAPRVFDGSIRILTRLVSSGSSQRHCSLISFSVSMYSNWASCKSKMYNYVSQEKKNWYNGALSISFLIIPA